MKRKNEWNTERLRMRDSFPRWCRLVTILALFLIPWSGTANGAVLLDDEPGRDGTSGKVIQGGGGILDNGIRGWKSGTVPGQYPHQSGYRGSDYVVYPLAGVPSFSPASGTIEMLIRRDAPGEPATSETLFEFLRPDNHSPLSVYVYWQRPHHMPWIDNGAVLTVWGDGYDGDLWGTRIALGREIPIGQNVRLTFTWGAGKNAVYIDGVPARGYYLDNGKPAPRSAAPARILGGVDRVRLGISSLEGAYYPNGYNPLTSAIIYRFVLQDQPVAPSIGRPVIKDVIDDTFRVAGISGKLVSGDQVNVELHATPGGGAAFDLGNVRGIPMVEILPREGASGAPAVSPGTYRGSYTIRPGDGYENGQVVGHFASADNVAADPVTSASKWTIDTKPVVVFSIDKKDLPADSSSKARIKLIAKDANGNPVKGRHMKLTLATTNEYTGTVGAGDFGKDVGATVETRWRGETDSWGEVEFDYTAGFAAKTVILSAKDLDSGGVTVDYVTAFKEALIDIALTPPVNRAAARRGMQYLLKMDASRTELTADGRSRSVIRATLLDPNAAPVAGDPVAFTLSSANGTLRTIAGTTDSSGTATAEYTAGKKIGIVVVTATATLRNASGNVSITLLSDAPAKVILKARPATLPADGNSRTDIGVKVTDINDNPNADTKVEYRIARGGGRLEYPDRLTDRFGDASNRYTAGTTPGVATIVATVRSKAPTDAELARARNVLFAPYSADGDEIRVEKWLKKKGDTAVRGEPVMEYTVGRSRQVQTLVAPYDLRVEEIFVEYWDRAEIGQTLAILAPATR